jgi:gluconolactonase
MDRIASGYLLAEAPVAAPDGGVFFSDVLGGGVYHWSPSRSSVETVIEKRRGVGGMAMHADGGLVVSGRDVSHVKEGGTRTLFASDDVAGLNDLTVDPDGRVVVGVLRFRPFAGEAPVPGEFLRIGSDGATTTVLPGVDWANGCAFSPDGRTFFGCDYHRGLVLAAERRSDGSYGAPRTAVVSPSGEADGMAVDENGALWVALGSRGTVGRFKPDGALDQELEVPASFVTSLCFGGDDGRDLFVTTLGNKEDPDTSGGVFLARSTVAGAPIPAVTSAPLEVRRAPLDE